MTSPRLAAARPQNGPVIQSVKRSRDDSTSTVAHRPLTTAETLIVELLLAHHFAGVDYTTLSSSCWVAPQLESLAHSELITWDFDAHGDFRIESTPKFFRLPEAELAWRRNLRALANPIGEARATKSPPTHS